MTALAARGLLLLTAASLGIAPGVRAQSAVPDSGAMDLAAAVRSLDERRADEALAHVNAALRAGQPADSVAMRLAGGLLAVMRDTLQTWPDVIGTIVVLKEVRAPEVRVALDFCHGLALFNQALEIRGTAADPDPAVVVRARGLGQLARSFLIAGRSFGVSAGFDVIGLLQSLSFLLDEPV